LVLYLIFVNDITILIDNDFLSLFADDTSSSTKDKTLQGVITKNNILCSKMGEWFSSNALIVNQSKTKSMVFSLKNFSSGEFMNENETVTFLGVTIDPKLSWKEHCYQLSRKLNSLSFLIRSLKQYVSPMVIQNVYYSCCQSVLSYCIIVWGHSCHAITYVFKAQRKIGVEMEPHNTSIKCALN